MTQPRVARFRNYHNGKAGSHDSSFPVGAHANTVVPRGTEAVNGMGSVQSAPDWRATVMFHKYRHSPCSSQAKQRGVTLSRDLLIKIAGSSTVTLYICQFTLLRRTMTPVAFFRSWKWIVQPAQRFCCDGCVCRQAGLCVWASCDVLDGADALQRLANSHNVAPECLRLWGPSSGLIRAQLLQAVSGVFLSYVVT